MIKGVRSILAIMLVFVPKTKRGKFFDRIEADVIKTDTLPNQIISGIMLCILALALLFIVCFTILKFRGAV